MRCNWHLYRVNIVQNMNERKEINEKDVNLSSTVSNFLITRKYASSKDLSSGVLSCSVMDLAVEKAIDSESGNNNILSFSSGSKDAATYFQQLEEHFLALKTFIAGTNQAYKQELTWLKYPIFVNIYLELVEKGQETKALKFYNQHVADFVTEHKEELQHFRGITCSEKLSPSDFAAHFRKSKFVCKLSHKVFTYLLQFLSSENRSPLLQYIDKNIHLDVNNAKLSLKQKDLESDHRNKETEEPAVRQTSLDSGQSISTDLIKLFRASRDEPPCLPSIILHKVSSCHQG